MNRRAVRRGSAAAAVVVLCCALLVAAAALAAKPKPRARFAGHTAATPIEGFRAPVSFTVAANGRSLEKFSFGSFGCFGAGGFKPGVNPYTGHSIIPVGTVAVSSKGKISVSGAKSTYSAFGNKTVTTIGVSGSFTTPKHAAGTITFSQVISGKFNSTCGPAKIAFSATAK